MIGRLDTHKEICSECKGTSRDPKKRTRKCEYCNGTGMEEVCDTCGYVVNRGCNGSGALDETYCRMKGIKNE